MNYEKGIHDSKSTPMHDPFKILFVFILNEYRLEQLLFKLSFIVENK